jgi:hypothetical protein
MTKKTYLKLKKQFFGYMQIKNLKTWEVVKATKLTFKDQLISQLPNKDVVCWDLNESLLDTRKEWQILDNPETFFEMYSSIGNGKHFNVFLGTNLIQYGIPSKEEAEKFVEEKNQEIRDQIKERFLGNKTSNV